MCVGVSGSYEPIGMADNYGKGLVASRRIQESLDWILQTLLSPRILAGKRSRKGGKKGEDRASIAQKFQKMRDDARLHLRVVLRTMIPVTARVTVRCSGSCANTVRGCNLRRCSGAPRNNGNMGGQSAGDSLRDAG